MKKILTVLFFLISLAGFSQTTYYIDPAGVDVTNDGSITTPWKTLQYACTQVVTPGDIIHVNSGDYTETQQSVLSVAVSIEGSSSEMPSINFNLTYTNIPAIILHSSEGTNGNQHISGLYISGGTVSSPHTYSAIEIWGRSNVIIDHCQIYNFFSQGVTFIGTSSNTGLAPSTWATDNSFHDNIIMNCAEYRNPEYGQYGDGQGCLMLGGQGGIGTHRMRIYNNTITQVDRADTHNGYPIKFACNGFNKGLLIYNNTITAKPWDGVTWDFSMELWHSLGGIEIFGNTIQGDIDFGGCALSGGVCVQSGGVSISAQDVGGVYGFAAKIYGNTLGQESMRTREEWCITPERGITGGFYVYNNWFKNVANAMQMYQGDNDVFEDLYVYCNVFYNIGILGGSSGNTIDWGTMDYTHTMTYDDIYFDHNTIYAGIEGYAANSGLRFNFPAICTDLYVRNNIIYGFDAYAIYFGGYPVTTGLITNNVFYANASNTIESGGASITLTIGTNYVTNPAFNNAPANDFHILNSGSAYHAGLYISTIITDYDGVEFNNPPSIGAYEYTGVSIYIPTVTTATITSIGTTTATGGGEVTNTGGSAVYARGICWSLTIPPTTADYTYNSGSGLGTFTSYLTGLTAATTYYVRAYASNSAGTGYGSLVTFQTNPEGGVEYSSGPVKHIVNGIERPVKVIVGSRSYFVKKYPYDYTYYVDATGGDDSHNGLSIAQAWKTIAKVNASTFQPNTAVLFKRGDTWRETLVIPSSGTSSSYITFRSYGTGNKPKILGSDQITTWVQGTITGQTANNDLIEESFEGAGYEESWSETIGANESNLVDEDNTEVARPTGGGSQILKIVKDITPTGTATASRAYTDTDLGSVRPVTYVDFYVRVNAHGLSAGDYVYLYKGGDASWDNVNTLFLRNTAGDIRFFATRFNNNSEDGYYYPSTGSITLDQWYHVQILYDVTNHKISCTIDNNYLYAGDLIGTHKAGIQHIILGDGSYVKTLTAYFDLVNISTTNFQIDDLVLPANTWASSNTLTDPYLMQYGGNIYFTELDGSISWGRVKKSIIGDLAQEYDWLFYGGRIIVYSTTDPGVTYTNVEVAQREYGINLNNKEYLKIDGLEVAYSGMYGIGDLWPATNINGLVVQNNSVHHIGRKEYGHNLELWHSHMIVKNNTIYDSGRRGISLNTYEGDCQLHNVIVEGNILYNGNHTTGVDISSFGATSTIDSIVIRKNLIYDDPTVDFDQIETFRSAGIYAEMEGAASVSNIYVYNNVIRNTSYIGLLFISIPQSYIYNNTFYGVNPYATEDYDGMIEILGTTTNTAIKNNIVYNNNVAATRVHYSCMFENASGTLDCDYNLFYNTDAASDLVRISGTSYLPGAWATYKTATGYDAHSPAPANPLFVSSTNYQLQTGSPAINAGTSGTGIPITDYLGHPRVGLTDIGAYEKQ